MGLYLRRNSKKSIATAGTKINKSLITSVHRRKYRKNYDNDDTFEEFLIQD